MKRLLPIFLIISFYSSSTALAQWEYQPNPNGRSPYFINANYGFLYSYISYSSGWLTLEGLAADPAWDTCHIQRTTDGGKTWVDAKDYGGMDGTPLGMYFVTPAKGYIAVSQSLGLAGKAPASSGGLYATVDSGMTWRRISPFTIGYDAVYAYGDTIIASATSISDLRNEPDDLTEKSGLMRSTDAGKSWEYISASYRPGHDIDGNDLGLIVAPNRPVPNTIAVSTNYGKDWVNYTVLLQDPAKGQITNVYVPRGTEYVFGAESENVLRSKDGGKTWERCYTVPNGGKGLLGVDGDGCVVYAHTGDRIIRSTNWGDSWDVVNTSGTDTYKSLSVVGNGAIVYTKLGTIDPSTRLLAHTTSGGDFTLSPVAAAETVEVTRQAFSSTGERLTSLDTVRVKLCDSITLAVQFTYAGQCNSAWLKAVMLDGLNANGYRSAMITRRSAVDSATLIVAPKVAGTFQVSVRVRYEEDDWTVRDTVFSLVLIVESNPSSLTLESKPHFDLGLQRLCNPLTVRDSLSLSARGCEPYRIQSIRFEDDDANSGYTFDTQTDLLLQPDGSKRWLYLSFLPNRAGLFTGRIIISHQDGEDTIEVTARAEEDSRTLVALADTMTAAMCQTVESSFELQNTSCRLMTLEALDLPAAMVLLPGQMPIGIQAGKSIRLRIQFTPATEGPLTVAAVAHLKFVGQTETIAFDTVFRLSVLALPGAPMTTTSDTTIDLGDVSVCSQRTFTVPIESFGCDTLAISSFRLSSADQGFAISTIPPPSLPVGESTFSTLTFTPPAVGTFTTDLVVTTNAGTRRILLTANVISGTKTISSSLNAIDFGQSNICEQRDSIIRFTNTGCDTLTITSATIDKNFVVGGAYPVKLAPGESFESPIVSLVDTTGAPAVLVGYLTIISTADNNVAPITLTRELIYPTKLKLEASETSSGKIGDVVKFRVLLEGQVPATMTALHFDFLHNADLLSWEGYDGIGLNRANVSGNEQQRSSFTLSPVHDGVICEFSFRTNLALAEQTTLSFDNIRFEARGVSVAPECIAVILDSGSRFNYIYTCGDNIIRDRLNGTRLIKSITPNPAKDEIVLELNTSGAAEIIVIDALGKVRSQSLGKHIDVRGLPSGVYYLRVTSNGMLETRRIVVAK